MKDYSREWRQYRKLRDLALGVLISASLLLISMVLIGPLETSRPVLLVAILVAAVVVFSAAIVTAIRVEGWGCPRCGRSFVSKWRSKFGVFFVTECANCGLRKWSND
jgi:hypothetical protein